VVDIVCQEEQSFVNFDINVSDSISHIGLDCGIHHLSGHVLLKELGIFLFKLFLELSNRSLIVLSFFSTLSRQAQESILIKEVVDIMTVQIIMHC
jgi:hypothetical protein